MTRVGERPWSAKELYERWTLSPDDLAFIAGNADAGRLGPASQLAFWRSQGRFPDEEADLAPAVIARLAGQRGPLAEDIAGWFAARREVRPGSYRLDRLIRSVRVGHGEAVLAAVADRLDAEARSRLDALLADDGAGAAGGVSLDVA